MSGEVCCELCKLTVSLYRCLIGTADVRKCFPDAGLDDYGSHLYLLMTDEYDDADEIW